MPRFVAPPLSLGLFEYPPSNPRTTDKHVSKRPFAGAGAAAFALAATCEVGAGSGVPRTRAVTSAGGSCPARHASMTVAASSLVAGRGSMGAGIPVISSTRPRSKEDSPRLTPASRSTSTPLQSWPCSAFSRCTARPIKNLKIGPSAHSRNQGSGTRASSASAAAFCLSSPWRSATKPASCLLPRSTRRTTAPTSRERVRALATTSPMPFIDRSCPTSAWTSGSPSMCSSRYFFSISTGFMLCPFPPGFPRARKRGGPEGPPRLQLVGISDRFAYQLIAWTASTVSAAWTWAARPASRSKQPCTCARTASAIPRI